MPVRVQVPSEAQDYILEHKGAVQNLILLQPLYVF